MHIVKRKLYKVSWSTDERCSSIENNVYYTFKEAKAHAMEPLGWYGGTGSIYSQIVLIDKDTNKIIAINDPEYIG